MYSKWTRFHPGIFPIEQSNIPIKKIIWFWFMYRMWIWYIPDQNILYIALWYWIIRFKIGSFETSLKKEEMVCLIPFIIVNFGSWFFKITPSSCTFETSSNITISIMDLSWLIFSYAQEIYDIWRLHIFLLVYV